MADKGIHNLPLDGPVQGRTTTPLPLSSVALGVELLEGVSPLMGRTVTPVGVSGGGGGTTTSYVLVGGQLKPLY